MVGFGEGRDVRGERVGLDCVGRRDGYSVMTGASLGLRLGYAVGSRVVGNLVGLRVGLAFVGLRLGYDVGRTRRS